MGEEKVVGTGRSSRCFERRQTLFGILVNDNPPTFCVSVASKEVSSPVSLLFATLAGRSISVAAKGLTGASYWRESNWVGWEDLEGVRRTARREAIRSEAPSTAGAYTTQAL